jgi:hypothetical protein
MNTEAVINSNYTPAIASGKRLHNELENHHVYIMGKSTISMAIFNSYVKLPKGTYKYINTYKYIYNIFMTSRPDMLSRSDDGGHMG